MDHVATVSQRTYDKFKSLSSTYPSYSVKKFIDQFNFLFYEHICINTKLLCIIIECGYSNGFGDIYIGLKITEALAQYFKNVNIIVTSNESVLIKAIDDDTYLNYKNITVISNDNLTQHLIDYKQYKIIMLTLALGSKIANDVLSEYNITRIYIDEYNGWRALDRLNGMTYAGEENIEYDYHMIPGFGVDSKSSMATCGINIDNKAHFDFALHYSDYHFGYVSDANGNLDHMLSHIYTFVSSVVLSKKLAFSVCEFVIVANSVTPQQIRSLFEDKHICSIEFNFSDIEYYDDHEATIFDDTNNISIRHIKLLSHDAMAKYMYNSLEPILVTGDQSLAEAISYKKLFFYQLPRVETGFDRKLYRVL